MEWKFLQKKHESLFKIISDLKMARALKITEHLTFFENKFKLLPKSIKQ